MGQLMRLYFLPHSPYVRKVRVAAYELGIADAIDLYDAHPFTQDSELLQKATVGKGPALATATTGFGDLVCAFL